MVASGLSYLTQTGEEKNFNDRIQSLVNSIKPVKMSGIVGLSVTLTMLDTLMGIFEKQVQQLVMCAGINIHIKRFLKLFLMG